jgi:hypothetical protein
MAIIAFVGWIGEGAGLGCCSSSRVRLAGRSEWSSSIARLRLKGLAMKLAILEKYEVDGAGVCCTGTISGVAMEMVFGGALAGGRVVMASADGVVGSFVLS